MRTVLLCLAVALGLSRAAHAQASVFGAYVYSDLSFGTPSCPETAIICLSGTVAQNRDISGFAAGAAYDLPSRYRWKFGVDVRGATAGALISFNARVRLEPHRVRLRPYLEYGVGHVTASTTSTNLCLLCALSPGPAIHAGNAAFTGGYGLDIRLSHGFDLRLIDVGAALSLGNASSSSTVTVVSIGTGLVYHFRSPATPNP